MKRWHAMACGNQKDNLSILIREKGSNPPDDAHSGYVLEQELHADEGRRLTKGLGALKFRRRAHTPRKDGPICAGWVEERRVRTCNFAKIGE